MKQNHFFKISAETILFLEQSSKVKLFSLQSEQDGATWGIAGCPQYWRGPCSDVWKDWSLQELMLVSEVCSEVVWVPSPSCPGSHEQGTQTQWRWLHGFAQGFYRCRALVATDSDHWPLATPWTLPSPRRPSSLGSRQDAGQTGTPMIHSSTAPGVGADPDRRWRWDDDGLAQQFVLLPPGRADADNLVGTAPNECIC